MCADLHELITPTLGEEYDPQIIARISLAQMPAIIHPLLMDST
jgi:hypothetical protein